MKVIHANPAVELECYTCKSKLSAEPEDFTAKVNTICGNIEFCDSPSALWTCPVCGNQHGSSLIRLPWEYQKFIKSRMTGHDAAQMAVWDDDGKRALDARGRHTNATTLETQPEPPPMTPHRTPWLKRWLCLD